MSFELQALDGTIWDAEVQPNPDTAGNKSRNSFRWNPYTSKLGRFFQDAVKGSIFELIQAIHEKVDINTLDGDFLLLHEALIQSIENNIVYEQERLRVPIIQVADILVRFCQYPECLKELYKNNLFRSTIIPIRYGMLIYDREAFKYEDQRLRDISGLLKNEILTFWDNDKSLQKAADCFVFLMKEDIRWRRVFLKILKEIDPTVHNIAQKNRSDVLIALCRLCEIVRDMKFTPFEIANAGDWT